MRIFTNFMSMKFNNEVLSVSGFKSTFGNVVPIIASLTDPEY